jgi:hypothetical protein
MVVRTGIKRARARPARVVGTKSIVKERGKVGTGGIIRNIVIGGQRVVDSSDTQNDLDALGPAVGDIVLKRCTVAQQI